MLRGIFTKRSSVSAVSSDAPSTPPSLDTADLFPGRSDPKVLGAMMAEAEISSEQLLTVVEELPAKIRALSEANSASLRELSVLQSLHAGVAGQLEETSRANRALSKANANLASELREIVERADSLHIELGATRAEHQDLGVRMQTTESERAALSQRVSELEALLRRFKHQLEAATALQTRSSEDFKESERQLMLVREALQRETDLRVRNSDAADKELARLTKDLDEERAQISTLRTSGARLEEELREATVSVQAGEERRALLEAELRRIHEAHATLLQRYEALEEDSLRQINTLDAKREALSSKCVLLEQLLHTAREQSHSISTELVSANTENRALRFENQQLVKEIDRLSAELTDVRIGAGEKDTAARALSKSNDSLLLQLREAQSARGEAERRAAAAVEELVDATAISQRELEDLQQKFELASGELNRLKLERALLIGQLEVARKDKINPKSIMRADPEDPGNVFVLQASEPCNVKKDLSPGLQAGD